MKDTYLSRTITIPREAISLRCAELSIARAKQRLCIPLRLTLPESTTPKHHSSILSSVSSASRPNNCTTPSIAATCSLCILLPTPVHSPSLKPPCSSNSNPLVRSKCRRVCVSIYSLLSSLALSQSTFLAAAGKVCSFGRRLARRERNAGSCDSAKLTFVVSGACEDEPTPRALAEGFSCRNANNGGFVVVFCAPGSSSLVSEPVRLEGSEERRDRSWAIVASLRADSWRSAVWSFCVSWTRRRCRLMDSGVGLSGEVLNDRFYFTCDQLIQPWNMHEAIRRNRKQHANRWIYLIMAQSDPTPQLLRHAQDTPQGKDLKLIKVLVDRGLQQCFQLMHSVLNLLPRFGILDVAVAICVSDR